MALGASRSRSGATSADGVGGARARRRRGRHRARGGERPRVRRDGGRQAAARRRSSSRRARAGFRASRFARVTALAIGLLAAWHGTRAEIRETLSSAQRTQAGSGSGATIRRALVVSQMALTVILLVGAGVLARSFVRLMEVNPGLSDQPRGDRRRVDSLRERPRRRASSRRLL